MKTRLIFYIEKPGVAFTSNRRSQKIYSFAMLSEKFGDSCNFKLPAHWYLLTAVWSLESIRITCTVWILGAVYAMDMAIPKRHRYFVFRVVQSPPIMISVLNITPMAQYLISMVARIEFWIFPATYHPVCGENIPLPWSTRHDQKRL